MKRVLSVFFILIITVVCFISASAHPGRTDSNGGHWNHDTGEYHYHHGYGPHSHDDGFCPIEPDNDRYYYESATRKESITSSLGYNDSDSQTPQANKNAALFQKISKDYIWSIHDIIHLVFSTAFSCFILYLSIKPAVNARKENSKEYQNDFFIIASIICSVLLLSFSLSVSFNTGTGIWWYLITFLLLVLAFFLVTPLSCIIYLCFDWCKEKILNFAGIERKPQITPKQYIVGKDIYAGNVRIYPKSNSAFIKIIRTQKTERTIIKSITEPQLIRLYDGDVLYLYDCT